MVPNKNKNIKILCERVAVCSRKYFHSKMFCLLRLQFFFRFLVYLPFAIIIKQTLKFQSFNLTLKNLKKNCLALKKLIALSTKENEATETSAERKLLNSI